MADNQFEQAAPAPEAQIPATQGPGLYAINYLDNWNGEGDTYYLVAERTKDGRWLNNESGCELLKYQGDAVLEVWPLTSGTTSDKYRAELYDEVWEKARALGHGNITEALAELDRLRTAPAGVPDGFLLVTQEQLERHATTAWECPPQSRVVLVSSIKRLHDKNAAAPAAPAPAPAAHGQGLDYQSTFNAIAAATRIEAGGIAISVQAFKEAMATQALAAQEQCTICCGTGSIAWDDEARRASNGGSWGRCLHCRPYTAPPAAEQPDTVKVERELLRALLADPQDDEVFTLDRAAAFTDLRALLGKDGEA